MSPFFLTAMMSFRTETSSTWTSSQIGTIVPSAASVCKRMLYDTIRECQEVNTETLPATKRVYFSNHILFQSFLQYLQPRSRNSSIILHISQRVVFSSQAVRPSVDIHYRLFSERDPHYRRHVLVIVLNFRHYFIDCFQRGLPKRVYFRVRNLAEVDSTPNFSLEVLRISKPLI